MSQSLALVLVHIIFSTKNPMPFLQSGELRSEVHAYLTGTLRGLECDPLQVGGVEDHLHILCGLSRKISLAGSFLSYNLAAQHRPSHWILLKAACSLATTSAGSGTYWSS